MIKKLKNQKGITGIDLTISIIIIMMFISIIAALSMNLSTSLASKRRLDAATNCMTEIMEKLDEIDYSYVHETKDEDDKYVFFTIKNIDNKDENITYNSELDPTNLNNEIAGIIENNPDYRILSAYLKVENYTSDNWKTENPDEQAPDVLKKVTVQITYKLNNENETIEITRLKPRYNVDLEETTTTETN